MVSLEWRTLGASLALVIAGCASSGSTPKGPSSDPLRNYDPDRATLVNGNSTFTDIYAKMGLAASGPPISFVGGVAFFATKSPDTTLVVLGLSIPNRGLTFKHDASGYAAAYVVGLSIDTAGGAARQARDSESVRVSAFKETSRTDESIIFKRMFRVAPGKYRISFSVDDVNGNRSASRQATLGVPRLGGRPGDLALSTLVPIYEATPRATVGADPVFLPEPRSSYVFGVDAVAPVYIESYDTRTPVTVALRSPNGAIVWQESVALTPHGTGLASGIVRVPLLSSDVGIATALATRPGTSDTVNAQLLIGFGPDLPILSFKDMLSYLQYFVPPQRLKALYNASPAERGALWSAFLKSTDSDPTTTRNEALDEYFGRIRDANVAFVNDVRGGWRSDRGRAFVGLGSPTNAYEDFGSGYIAGDPLVTSSSRVRYLIWDYPEFQSRLLFYDANDSGQWRFTRSSEILFQQLLERKMHKYGR